MTAPGNIIIELLTNKHLSCNPGETWRRPPIESPSNPYVVYSKFSVKHISWILLLFTWWFIGFYVFFIRSVSPINLLYHCIHGQARQRNRQLMESHAWPVSRWDKRNHCPARRPTAVIPVSSVITWTTGLSCNHAHRLSLHIFCNHGRWIQQLAWAVT